MFLHSSLQNLRAFILIGPNLSLENFFSVNYDDLQKIWVLLPF